MYPSEMTMPVEIEVPTVEPLPLDSVLDLDRQVKHWPEAAGLALLQAGWGPTGAGFAIADSRQTERPVGCGMFAPVEER